MILTPKYTVGKLPVQKFLNIRFVQEFLLYSKALVSKRTSEIGLIMEFANWVVLWKKLKVSHR